ncbi:MAG: hypothetical protein KC684_10035 [Candidatus Omnitrophica bacterium]|nr:hypothetical protein [Candidatus Omnitrophota bacterium]
MYQIELFKSQKANLRPIPRPFEFPWGKGLVVEEVSYKSQHHEPAIQLLQFESGFELVRFCSYTLSGRFEKNSWIANSDEIAELGRQLNSTPRLKEILKKMSQ